MRKDYWIIEAAFSFQCKIRGRKTLSLPPCPWIRPNRISTNQWVVFLAVCYYFVLIPQHTVQHLCLHCACTLVYAAEAVPPKSVCNILPLMSHLQRVQRPPPLLPHPLSLLYPPLPHITPLLGTSICGAVLRPMDLLLYCNLCTWDARFTKWAKQRPTVCIFLIQ